uniref:Uncharacterized protein n=1 Tax=Anguilla anguilla TaxID=7936 RepID=A0A0E9RZ06_ANGAN
MYNFKPVTGNVTFFHRILHRKYYHKCTLI